MILPRTSQRLRSWCWLSSQDRSYTRATDLYFQELATDELGPSGIYRTAERDEELDNEHEADEPDEERVEEDLVEVLAAGHMVRE